MARCFIISGHLDLGATNAVLLQQLTHSLGLKTCLHIYHWSGSVMGAATSLSPLI